MAAEPGFEVGEAEAVVAAAFDDELAASVAAG